MPCDYFLSVAGLIFQIATDRPLFVGASFRPFLTACGEPDITATVSETEKLHAIPDTQIQTEMNYRFCADENRNVYRFFYDEAEPMSPYAVVLCKFENGCVYAEYLESGAMCFTELQNTFYHLGFEALLIHKKRLYFHAACIETHLGGILFSGPSGIGKSTQAELWCKYRDARQINGDRPILQRTDDGWLAWGSPYAGSSRVYVNDSCSVTAIVMLRQAKECSLRRLTAPEAFRAVWSGLTVHTWDEAFVTLACDLAMDLAAIVPVYEFCCTPDEYAVSYLEQALRKELCL